MPDSGRVSGGPHASPAPISLSSIRQQWQQRDAVDSAKIKPAVRRTSSSNLLGSDGVDTRRRMSAQRWTSHFEKYDLKHKLARVLASDPDCTVLDLTNNTQ